MLVIVVNSINNYQDPLKPTILTSTFTSNAKIFNTQDKVLFGLDTSQFCKITQHFSLTRQSNTFFEWFQYRYLDYFHISGSKSTFLSAQLAESFQKLCKKFGILLIKIKLRALLLQCCHSKKLTRLGQYAGCTIQDRNIKFKFYPTLHSVANQIRV